MVSSQTADIVISGVGWKWSHTEIRHNRRTPCQLSSHTGFVYAEKEESWELNKNLNALQPVSIRG